MLVVVLVAVGARDGLVLLAALAASWGTPAKSCAVESYLSTSVAAACGGLERSCGMECESHNGSPFLEDGLA